MPREMTREEVLAEREARKKAKLAKKKPKENTKHMNDVGNNVPKMNSTIKKSVTDGSVESPAPIHTDGASPKEVTKSGTDYASPRDGPKRITNQTSPAVGRKSVADSAPNPGAGRKSVTDGASPQVLKPSSGSIRPVNDQVDGCILRPRQPFQDFSELTPEMVQKKLNHPGYNILIDTGSYLVKDARSVINELISGTTEPVKCVTEQVKSTSEPVKSTTEPVESTTEPVESTTEPVKSTTEPVKSATEPVKSKAELKAERRAKQEAQRAAKATAKTAPVKPALKPVEMKPAKSAIKKSTVKTNSEGKSKSVTFASPSTKQASQNKIKLFSHLYRERNINYKSILNSSDLHPAVVGLGVQYSNRVIAGSNARCVALLHVLKQMFSDYKTPAEKEFSRGFEAKLEPTINYLNQCRPISVSMTNALKHIKWHLTQLPNNITDAEGRLKMSHVITTYIKEQIEVAGKAISLSVQKKIANGDVILTFGCSSLVERILKEAHEAAVDFSVVIIDSAPWFEGKEMLRRLVKAKIPCTYVLISAASFIMKQASKVLLGAHALLANGCVMSRSGTALVALLANTANVPVLVCCETHKFSERVQTDAFVYNELGDPDELVSSTSPVIGWESNSYLVPLSLVYDVTPPDLVTAVVTELAILPCTSVPVILRVKPTESA